MITHPDITGFARNAACNAVVDLIDLGVAANGTLEFQTSGGVEVATLQFSNPAFGDAAGGMAASNPITADPSATGGTIARFQVKDCDGNVVFQGTVTGVGGGGDIERTNRVITFGAPVSHDYLYYSAAP